MKFLRYLMITGIVSIVIGHYSWAAVELPKTDKIQEDPGFQAFNQSNIDKKQNAQGPVTTDGDVVLAQQNFQDGFETVPEPSKQEPKESKKGIARKIDLRDLNKGGKFDAHGLVQVLKKEQDDRSPFRENHDQIIFGDGTEVELRPTPRTRTQITLNKVKQYWLWGGIKEIKFTIYQFISSYHDFGDMVRAQKQGWLPELIPDPSVDGGFIRERLFEVTVRFNRDGSIESETITSKWDGIKGLNDFRRRPDGRTYDYDFAYYIETETTITYKDGEIIDRKWKVMRASGALPRDYVGENKG